MNAAVVALVLGAAGPSAPERAKEAFDREDYAEAAAALAEAYELDPKPRYLFARAQSERLSGNCVVAIDLYDAFLATDPDAEAADLAREARAECAGAELPPPPPAPPPPRVVDDPDVADEEPAPVPDKRRWQRDPAGWALFGSGLAVTGVGLGLLGAGLRLDRAAAVAGNEGAFEIDVARAVPLHRAGIALTSVGAALIVGGIIRWAVVARAAKGTSPRRGNRRRSKASRPSHTANRR